MTDYVKPPRRRYRSPLRDARARVTRRRVLDSAAVRFVQDGYPAATVEAIAADAEVSAKTVYHLFGTKAGLLKEVMDVAFVADDEAIPLVERTGPQQVKAEPDQRRQIQLAARGTADLLERIRQINDVLTQAAAVDPDAAALRDDIELRQRREAMQILAEWFSNTGPLRDGMTIDHAADILWVLTSPEVHQLYQAVHLERRSVRRLVDDSLARRRCRTPMTPPMLGRTHLGLQNALEPGRPGGHGRRRPP
jgi:AcrR family transcriptional regulator